MPHRHFGVWVVPGCAKGSGIEQQQRCLARAPEAEAGREAQRPGCVEPRRAAWQAPPEGVLRPPWLVMLGSPGSPSRQCTRHAVRLRRGGTGTGAEWRCGGAL
eukprot:scaffold72067_cov63-Phaeocystis_antarctica.AAC.1